MNYLQKKKLAFMSIVNQIKGFIRTISGAFPLTLSDCVDNKSITNYSIHGNSMQDGVPTPGAPIEVESVGEKIVNLFEGYDEIIDGYYTATGDFIAEIGIRTAQYIAVKPNTVYTVKGRCTEATRCAYIRIAEFNSDKTFVNRNLTLYEYEPVITFKTTSDTMFLAICYDSDETGEIATVTDIQIDEGTVSNDYTLYGKYKIPITVSGKNLFNKSDYQVDVNGAIGFSIRHLKIGTKYTISSNKPLTWVKISLTSSGYNSVQFANENGFYKYSFTMQRHSNISENETQYLFLGSTVGERTFVNNISQLDGFDIQIEEGSTTTDYEPYHELISTNIYLDEPLRKVGDYADYIDFENNEIVRNIGKYTFTGDEQDQGGAVGYTGSFGYTVRISGLSLTAHKVGLCNYLTQSDLNGSVNRFAFHGIANHPYCYIFFLEKDFPELGTYSPETAKQIVKQMYDGGEPLILYYNTNTPTKETVELPIIPTFKGTSIISVDTTIQPSNAEIEYYSNAKER